MHDFFDKQGGVVLGLVQDGCVVPVGAMVLVPGMFCYGRLLSFPSFGGCLVLFKAGLQVSLCLSNVCEITVSAGYLVYHS